MNISFKFFFAYAVAAGLHVVAGNCSDANFCDTGLTCVDSGDNAFTLDNGTIVPYCSFVVPPDHNCGRMFTFPQQCPRMCQNRGTLYENVLNDTHSEYLCRCEGDNNFRNYAVCAGTALQFCFNGLPDENKECSPGYTCVIFAESLFSGSYCTQDPDNVPLCLEHPGGPIDNSLDCYYECQFVHKKGHSTFWYNVTGTRSMCRCNVENDGICASPFEIDDSTNAGMTSQMIEEN